VLKYFFCLDVVVSPTFLHLDYVKNHVAQPVLVSAQNCSLTGNGAFTGEISADALVDFGLKWVILGHSERRTLYGESDSVVASKVTVALKAGLGVIFCIGEKLEERKAEQTFEVCFRQMNALSERLKPEDWDKIVVAYEPVWAIGTGLTATPAQAQQVHVALRNWLKEKIGDRASKVRIIYGGSVKPDNAVELMREPDIDGFLVGGASLKASDFGPILKSPETAGRL
jgi:triosephosphate isomerase